MPEETGKSGAGLTRKNRKGRRHTDAPLTRSENMSRIRGKNTRPEMVVRRALWAAGLRYRLHEKKLPGHPDLVFPSRRTVVFVHGCFWHCHEGCKHFRIPKTRTDWWVAKLERNVARDKEACTKLRAAGWRVIVIWECEVEKKIDGLVDELRLLPVGNGS